MGSSVLLSTLSTDTMPRVVSASNEDHLALLQVQLVARRTSISAGCVRKAKHRDKLYEVEEMTVSREHITIETRHNSNRSTWKLMWKDYVWSEATDAKDKGESTNAKDKGLAFTIWGAVWRAESQKKKHYTVRQGKPLKLIFNGEECQSQIDRFQSEVHKYAAKYSSRNRDAVPTRKGECVISSPGWNWALIGHVHQDGKLCNGKVEGMELTREKVTVTPKPGLFGRKKETEKLETAMSQYIRIKTRTTTRSFACKLPLKPNKKTSYTFEIDGTHKRKLTIFSQKSRWFPQYYHMQRNWYKQKLALQCDCEACHELLGAVKSKIGAFVGQPH
eukprot:gnl/TRDRNA2_/TRDRNA2_94161_c0_seq1.p1 gnl/TRDRNA2_/TRDRNA2_94161_c0~~gnl/TRDRNA2_/TRDRNA2_94161_c0_seq1.p1  ORF type:complete len:332 (+),score=18.78 gnl/TRDRNA2_/TRDRNA2_94161_c0_seq1:338-1333(+)